MPFELWGATSAPRLIAPERPFGYFLLAVYVLLLATALLSQRGQFRRLSARQWLLVAVLSLASITVSQLFPWNLSSESQLPPLGVAQNPVSTLVPFGVVPLIVAGALLNPLAALIVGLSNGLGRALWQTHQLTDPFHFALAAWLFTGLVRQNYRGWLYDWLRRPILSAPLSMLAVVPLVGLAAFAYADPNASNLAALDLASSVGQAQVLPLLVEGFVGGLIASLVLLALQRGDSQVPALRQHLGSQSLNRRLIYSFLGFAFLFGTFLLTVGFNLAVRLATELVVEQMAHDAQVVSAEIPDFRALRQNLLVQLSQDEELTPANAEQSRLAMRQVFRAGDFYQLIALIDGDKLVAASYPREPDSVILTNQEIEAVDALLATGAPSISSAQPGEVGDFFVSFIVPVLDGQGVAEAALVGRVPGFSLEELAVGLQGTLGQGRGFLVDELGQVIAHPDQADLLTIWNPPETNPLRVDADNGLAGVAYRVPQGSTNARQITYFQTGPDHPWTTVINLPYEVILGQAIQIALQLAALLIAAIVVSALMLFSLGRTVTQQLGELAHASQEIASGRLNTPIRSNGNDEIGRLGKAFGQMQKSLRRHIDEQSLLLRVSQDVSESLDINKGMPTILQGALRGTGAAGARVVVMNPSGSLPLTFGEGPNSSAMARFDRQVTDLLRHQPELMLSTPAEVQTALLNRNSNGQELPVRSLIALPLTPHNQFRGVLWLSYRQAHGFDSSEQNFLRNLSSQASFLAEKSLLFAVAEGGRRRLAAVLSSTTDAVIVTDQRDRIIMVNPAMARFFQLNENEITGLSVKSVLHSQPLIEALTNGTERTRNLQIPVGEGKILNASTSTVRNNEGQAIGRVAVLHDVTHFKELDELKSEFVAAVSHDLRNPLNLMLNYATMLPEFGELAPKQKEYVKKILSNIEHMTDQINKLLDIGRLEAGVDIMLREYSVRELLSNLAEEQKEAAHLNGLDLVTELPARMPLVQGDADLVRLAVSNLISNAIKYAPYSGRLVLAARAEDNNVVISLQDNGPGISESDQARLFDKFYRVENRRTRDVKGTGLGLSLVQSVAERHGGRAWLESALGKGSTFFISFPIRPLPDEQAQLLT